MLSNGRLNGEFSEIITDSGEVGHLFSPDAGFYIANKAARKAGTHLRV